EQLRQQLADQQANPELSASLEKQKQELTAKVAELERAQQVAMAWAEKEEEGLRKQLEKARGRLVEREEGEAKLAKALEKQSEDWETERAQRREEIIVLRRQLELKTARVDEIGAERDRLSARTPFTETVPEASPQPTPEPVVAAAEPEPEPEVNGEELKI